MKGISMSQEYPQNQQYSQPMASYPEQPPQNQPNYVQQPLHSQPNYAQQVPPQQALYQQTPVQQQPVQQALYQQAPVQQQPMQQAFYPQQPMQQAFYPQQPVQQQVNMVNVNIQQRQGPGLFVRLIYFWFIGWWVGLFWLNLGFALCAFIVTLPVGLMMLNRLPRVMTLRPAGTSTQVNVTSVQAGPVSIQNVNVTVGGTQQHNFFVRALYYVFIGCWAGYHGHVLLMHAAAPLYFCLLAS
jgi:uncharacterized membrane protein YccF (DUF307 family)